MTNFIDTQSWPLVRMQMPEQVPDALAESLIAELARLYERKAPFVLHLDGAELPRDSRLFMQAYTRWRDKNLEAQKHYCLGAYRIEPDNARREAYQARATAWDKSGQAAYEYRVFADEIAAQAQVRRWLERLAGGNGDAAAPT